MLAKKYRLGGSLDFRNTRIIQTSLFTIKVKKNESQFNRFAIIVGKKVDKRAVIRNRTKRMISKALELFFKQIDQGYDMLILARKEARDATKKQLSERMYSVFHKERLLTYPTQSLSS